MHIQFISRTLILFFYLLFMYIILNYVFKMIFVIFTLELIFAISTGLNNFKVKIILNYSFNFLKG